MSDMRRQFDLPDFDQEYLNGLGLSWETIIENRLRWVVVHRYPVAPGYNCSVVSAALQLSSGYPDTHIDMVYFNPALSLVGGGTIRQLTNQSLDGKVWQRWSRHRTAANPWRRDFDCIETHLLLVDEWLSREVPQVA